MSKSPSSEVLALVYLSTVAQDSFVFVVFVLTLPTFVDPAFNCMTSFLEYVIYNKVTRNLALIATTKRKKNNITVLLL